MTYRPHDYGEMELTDNTSATTISSQNAWVQITGLSAGELDGMTFSSNTLAARRSGDYMIIGSGAATPASTNTSFEFGIFKSDSLVTKSKTPVRFGAAQAQPFSLSGVIVNMTDTDVVSVRVRNLDDTSNITVDDLAVTLLQI